MEKLEKFQTRIKKEKDPEFKKDLSLIYSLARKVKKAGGRALVVGGFVRDEILTKLKKGSPSKDIDLEVYGLKVETLKKIISGFGKINLVGESFSVFKLGKIDISLPRKDSKISKGHKGFEVKYDPKLSFREASRRRDFTINAIGIDPLTGEVLDEYNGIADLKKGIIKAVDSRYFGDDPLRVLRAAQFASRFNFEINPATIKICQKLDLKELSWERINEEMRKLLVLSPKPSIGMEYARQLGIIKKLMPEVQTLIGLKQYKVWHPEGDVWTHTLMVMDEAAKLIRKKKLDAESSEIQIWAALTHDFGKAVTSVKHSSGKITSKGHCDKGVPVARDFLKRFKVSKRLIDKILPLVREHLFPAFTKDYGEAAVRRLARRMAPSTIDDLLIFTEADHRGRGVKWDGFPGAKRLKRKAEQLKLKEQAPKMIFMGRHLLELGYKPKGQEKFFGKVIKLVNEEELDGKIKNLNTAKRRAKVIAHKQGLKK